MTQAGVNLYPILPIYGKMVDFSPDVNAGGRGARFAALWQRCRAIVPGFDRVRRKPGALLHVLLSARKAQVFSALMLLALLFVVPPALEVSLRTLFPPVESSKLLGLVKKEKKNPAARTGEFVLTIILWGCAASSTAVLLWLHIPAGIRSAASKARRIEEQADDVSGSDPLEALRLYLKAENLMVLDEPEARLIDKIERLRARIGDGSYAESLVESNRSRAAGTLLRTDSDSDLIDRRFRIIEQLGKGAMGVVFRAQDIVLDREIALKELPARFIADESYVARFRREAKVLAKLTHQNILQLYDLVEANERMFMVLELIDGGDLAGYLRSHGKLSVADTCRFAIQLAHGLSYAHNQGVVHRDFKPSNVLLTSDLVPKISDFGLARLARASMMTQEGTILGSPRYMSPEQAAGQKADGRSDLYSLGITIYEMLTGTVPFDGETSQVLTSHITQTPPPPRDIDPDIPEPLETLILSLLAKDPGSRPASADEIIDWLGNFADESRITIPTA